MLNGPSSVVTRGNRPDSTGDWVVAAARVRASIGHPHLTRMRFQPTTRSRLAVELCSAPTLAQVLEEESLSPHDAVTVVDAVASAVEALAAHGLAPRELTPASVYLHRTRGAILSDPGAPAALVPRAEVVSPNARGYLSPEELAGNSLTARSLVYSLGTILGESVSRQAPASLTRVIERATDDCPKARYKNPRDFAGAATASVRGLKVAKSRPFRAAGVPGITVRRQEAQPEPEPDRGPKAAVRPLTVTPPNGAKPTGPAKAAKPPKTAKAAKPAMPPKAAKPAKPAAAKAPKAPRSARTRTRAIGAAHRLARARRCDRRRPSDRWARRCDRALPTGGGRMCGCRPEAVR